MKISTNTISFKFGSWIHNKTGNEYKLISKGIDTTNSRDGTEVAVYTNGHEVFVREWEEFQKKFKPDMNV